MRSFVSRGRFTIAASTLAIAASLMSVQAASAQATNSTLRGTVFDGQVVEAGGTILATEISTGFVSRGRVQDNGSYVISGLRPGTYRIDVTSADGQTATDTVTLNVGQVSTLDLDVAAASASANSGGVVTPGEDGGEVNLGEIVVTGRRLFEVRTSEVATSVSQQQINNLPQISRNFLNFAALAPGVRVTEGENERTISAGGQGAQAINVFVDGQNQKSTVIDGGVAGQDDSRGNPFPQAGVQEFRVISQNFKAEYEQAGSSIITAVTKSGTNEFTGEIFATYQNQDWIEQDVFAERRGEEKPELKREQYGFAFGGPIIQDRLNYFLTYERKDEARASSVFLNRLEYADQFGDELGTFASPFEQDLLFGKLSWQIDDRQRFELSGTYRSENEIRGFGNGPTAFSRAEEANTDVRAVNARYQFQGDRFLNEATVDYFSYTYNPTSLNFDDFGEDYVVFNDTDNTVDGFQFDINNRDSIFSAGGRSDSQFIEQESVTFRNDLTIPDLQWMGTHTIKLGAKYSIQTYAVDKQFGRNPQFVYDLIGRPEINGSTVIPVAVNLGAFVEPLEASNNVVGLYIQDDWQITDKLELNLGLRWDYEDNAVNNDYSTPQQIRDTLSALAASPDYDFPSYFDPSNYVTDGRDAFTGAFQPRFGFSYDVNGDEGTVIFGGAGRYYDRLGFNFAFDERFKPFQFNKTIYFSADGSAVGGNPAVAFDPSYLTTEGLDPLLAAEPGAGEIFLVKNDAEPPMTDQFNLGVRQRFGIFQTSLTFAYSKTKNLSAWYVANALTETGGRFEGPTPASVGFPQFREAIWFQNTAKEAEFKAMYLTVDKPFTTESNWGFNLVYTLSEATQNGSSDAGLVAFDFNYNTPGLSEEYPSATDERHRVVMSGTVGLPYDFRLSSIVTLGSGLPYTTFDCPDALNPGGFCFNAARPDRRAFLPGLNFAFRQVDLRLTKAFETSDGQSLELIVDAINVFGFDNYSGFDGGFLATDPANPGGPRIANPQFGQPTSQFLPTRSFQVGLRYTF